MLDNYIGTDVVVTERESVALLVNIMKQKNDNEGNKIGKEDANPILDSKLYDMEFPDVLVKEYSVHKIVENTIEQVDKHGWY